MANAQLSQYVAEARAQGVGDDMIRQELAKSGWTAGDINDVVGLKAPIAPASPKPAAPIAPQTDMWVALQYAICFICLYIVAIALDSILNAMIDKWLPNPATISSYYYASSGGLQIQFQLAALIVAAPIFICLFIVLRRQVTSNLSVRALPLRKGVIYFTIFFAAIISIGDLIWTIYDILSNNFSANGLGHLLALVVIAGSVIIYLVRDVREDRALLAR